MKKSPNEELTEKVVAALGEAGLITLKRGPEITSKMGSGEIKEADWRLWIEETLLASTIEGVEENHG